MIVAGNDDDMCDYVDNIEQGKVEEWSILPFEAHLLHYALQTLLIQLPYNKQNSEATKSNSVLTAPEFPACKLND